MSASLRAVYVFNNFNTQDWIDISNIVTSSAKDSTYGHSGIIPPLPTKIPYCRMNSLMDAKARLVLEIDALTYNIVSVEKDRRVATLETDNKPTRGHLTSLRL